MLNQKWKNKFLISILFVVYLLSCKNVNEDNKIYHLSYDDDRLNNKMDIYCEDSKAIFSKQEFEDGNTFSLNVFNDSIFRKKYFDFAFKRKTGYGLYSLYCSDCHRNYGDIREVLKKNDFKPEMLYIALKKGSHIDLGLKFKHELNIYEIEAIREYILKEHKESMN